MCLGGSWRDPEPLADFLVGAAGRDQLHYLTLPLGQRQMPVGEDLLHGADASNARTAGLLSERRISRIYALRDEHRSPDKTGLVAADIRLGKLHVVERADTSE